MGLVAASDSVVCPPWLRSCVGLSTVPFRGQNSACQREFAFWSGVLTDEGNSLCVFCFVVSPAIGVWITVLGKIDFSVLLCSLRLGF
ncbi:hypothetical protein RHMOL_Rhmol03G0173900 [Rhododendron molle]|uniref:Uncharacterized protein n=1 Tax=Rhododendron molle TaxID=49168 RepID=A0ACC0PGV9_RHOML|nr:hypothetical protein RHMOL_Rhmol03G0173900 [Rhododendron molle]